MVGLSDVRSVGKAVGRISGEIVTTVFLGLYYTFNYRNLDNSLRSKIVELNNEKDKVARKAKEARDYGKIVYDDVSTWQREVGEIMESGDQVSPSWRCIQCLPIPNPISRFRIGREAVQKAKMVTEVIARGIELHKKEIAFLPPMEIVRETGSAFLNFHSRTYAYKKLWEMLVTRGSPQILGIYGMPGVGKTLMMQQIWEEATEKKFFDKVLRVDVGSEDLDVIKLQNQIAVHIDCHFNYEDDVNKRASMLKDSLMNEGKILVILDDVWWKIPLDLIGISSISIDCKILLASREVNISVLNNCKHPVSITTLTDDEALDLFTNTIGDQTDASRDESLVQKVCKKCAGLPVLIHAVGKALQFRSHNVWKDALSQLEYGKAGNIAGLDPHVYACVKLSIDRLPDDAKLCLFLCSMFSEDAGIHMRKLIALALGTQLVPEDESSIRDMIDILRLSSLLLDYQKDHMIKLHDFIRDVARSVASSDPKYAFLLVRCGLRLPRTDNYGTRKLLHIHLEKNDFNFPHDLECPDLHTLWLQCIKHIQQFSGGSFSMFVNLKVLFIQEGKFSSFELQFSLKPLYKLRTVILDNCHMTYIHQTKDSFFPESLETLCIWDCHLPRPMALPNQKNLRELEIVGKMGEVVFLPNTIARLSNLEKLHIRNGFQISDEKSALQVSIVSEISILTHLKSLQIFLEDSKHFQDTSIFCNLLQFNICVGKPAEYIGKFKKLIVLHGDQLEGLGSLMEKAEEVVMQRTTDVSMSKIWNSNKEAFADLRNLSIENCNTMMHLASISQDEIRSGQPKKSFSKLTILEIRNCSSIKYLFCNSVATCLRQLKELCIDNCPLMEVIVMDEGTAEGNIVNFESLKSLKLVGLPRLTSFYRNKSDQFQPLFHRMVAFPSLENLHIEYLEDISDIWAKHNYDIEVTSFLRLKSLKVSECDKLKFVIPLAMLPRLQKLKHLIIACCSSVISEVGTFGGNTVSCPLVALRSMDLESMPCLTETKLNSREYATTWYPNLENLRICDCNSLRNVFLPSTANSLVHFNRLCVVGCNKMTEIIGAGNQEITDGILLPKMTDLKLTRLPNLTSIWCHKVIFPDLVVYDIVDCEKLRWKR